MVRYFIELAYNGSRYHGWQIQPGASSVQEEINRALSTLLRQDIYVVGAGRTVPMDKHARFSAISRTYKYYIDKTKDPFTYPFAWKAYPLPDIQAMNEACRVLFDYTDFTSFSKLHTDVKTNNCIIYEAQWEETDKQLIFTVKANRFLRNMVRAIVGTLIDVGRGKLTPEDVRKIIESKNRCNAGTSVPAQALFLCHIEYPE